MALFLKNISFHGILLDALFEEGNREWVEVSQLLKQGIASGVVQPLRTTIFQRSEVEDAFRYMAQGKHIGKVLLQVEIYTLSKFLCLWRNKWSIWKRYCCLKQLLEWYFPSVRCALRQRTVLHLLGALLSPFRPFAAHSFHHHHLTSSLVDLGALAWSWPNGWQREGPVNWCWLPALEFAMVTTWQQQIMSISNFLILLFSFVTPSTRLCNSLFFSFTCGSQRVITLF